MKYKKIKQIARLSFMGRDAVEVNFPYPKLTFNTEGLETLKVSDNSFISLESFSFEGNDTVLMRCPKLGSGITYYDSAQKCRGSPIIFTSNTGNGNEPNMFNPDPLNLFKFPTNQSFFSSPSISFTFDVAIPNDLSKNRMMFSFIVYDEEDEYTESNIEVGNDDWKTGKKFGMIY